MKGQPLPLHLAIWFEPKALYSIIIGPYQLGGGKCCITSASICLASFL